MKRDYELDEPFFLVVVLSVVQLQCTKSRLLVSPRNESFDDIHRISAEIGACCADHTGTHLEGHFVSLRGSADHMAGMCHGALV